MPHPPQPHGPRAPRFIGVLPSGLFAQHSSRRRSTRYTPSQVIRHSFGFTAIVHLKQGVPGDGFFSFKHQTYRGLLCICPFLLLTFEGILHVSVRLDACTDARVCSRVVVTSTGDNYKGQGASGAPGGRYPSLGSGQPSGGRWCLSCRPAQKSPARWEPHPHR